MASEFLKKLAVFNAASSIKKDYYFPDNVFVKRWEDYLFFEPHMMFDTAFIDLKNLIIREGNASVIALVNLRVNITANDNQEAIFLEQNTGVLEYMSKLTGDGSAMNWMYLMDRYVCASDKGNWSIYCEKEEDVAVFAFRDDFPKSLRSQVEDILKAESIMYASNSEKHLSFDFDKLLPSWRSALTVEYIPSSIL